MKFKSIKRRLKEMKEPILEQMAVEQEFQARLRTTIITSEDEEEIEDNLEENYSIEDSASNPMNAVLNK